MNWLLILVIGLLAGNAFWGYKKGLLRVAFSLVSWALVLGICYFVTPPVVDMVMEKTDVVEIVQEQITEKINAAFDESAYAELEAAIPEELKKALLENADKLPQGSDLTNLGSQAIKELFSSTKIIYTALFFIISVVIALIARIAVQVVDIILGIASKLPLIGPVDKILGTALGAAKGLVWCWLVLAIVAMLALTGTNTEYIAMVQQSEFLTELYDNNIIVNMILQYM